MTLQELLLQELQDLYDAEHQLVDALPRLTRAARGDPLRATLRSHLDETRSHIARLEEAFALVGARAAGRRSAGMACIIEEGLKVLQHRDIEGAVLDAGLIAAAQKIEHYEMCGYGTCIAWARTLGLHQIAARLEETLEEEKAADQALSDIAVQEVNISATQESA